MSLAESLIGVFKKSKTTAADQYRRALSEGKPPEAVVKLALAAGIAEDQVAADAAIIDKAGALAETASGHTALAKKLDDANQRHAALAAEYQTAVNSFLERLNVIGEEVSAAQDAEAPAAKALNELTALYRDHASILPPAPAAVRTLMDEQDRATEVAKSRDEVRRADGRAAAIERKLLEARTSQRTPGATNVSPFSSANAAGMVPTLRQPVLQDDHAEFDAKQGVAELLEAELAQAQTAAQQLADAHATKFGELAP